MSHSPPLNFDSINTSNNVSVMLDLAVAAEQAGFGQQESCLTTARTLLAPLISIGWPDKAEQMLDRSVVYSQAGAIESAVLALIPPEAVYTAARLADGSVVAQIQLIPGRGAHSRRARWVGMAVLAGLLRSFADCSDNGTAEQDAA